MQHVVRRFRGCLGLLSPVGRTVLELRAGVRGHAYSARQVAGRLGLSSARERQLEDRSLATLRGAGSTGACSGSAQFVSLQASAPGHLAAVSPVLAGSGAGSAPSSGAPGRSSHPQAVDAVSASAPVSPRTVAAAVGRLSTKNAGSWLLVVSLALLGVLAGLSLIGRRAMQQRLLVAPAATGAAAEQVHDVPPPAADAPPAATGVADAAPADMAPPVTEAAAGAVAAAAAAGEPVATESVAPSAPAAAAVGPAPSSAPAATAPAAAVPGAGAGSWTRTHRTQIAVGAAAVAGAAARLLARRLRH